MEITRYEISPVGRVVHYSHLSQFQMAVSCKLKMPWHSNPSLLGQMISPNLSSVQQDNPQQSQCHHGPGSTQHSHLYNPLKQLAR